jgi:hypothetical protein
MLPVRPFWLVWISARRTRRRRRLQIGLTPRTLLRTCAEAVAETHRLGSMDLVEVNPIFNGEAVREACGGVVSLGFLCQWLFARISPRRLSGHGGVAEQVESGGTDG